MAANEEERRVTRRGASRIWAVWLGLAVLERARCKWASCACGGGKSEGQEVGLEGKAKTHRTDLTFPARVAIVVAGAAVWVCAREGGGRNVAESFALLINHACFCGVGMAGWTRRWREVGWAKSCRRRPGCGCGCGPASEGECSMKIRGA